MRINFTEEKMTYIGGLADKLDISIPDLIMKALHMVDTVQLCAEQNIKAVFIEEGEHLEFKDLFAGLVPSSGNDQQAVGATGGDSAQPVDPSTPRGEF